MAVINAYIDADIVAGKLASASHNKGVWACSVIQSFVVGATDAAGSIYRLFKGIPADAIITVLALYNDALTGATSVKMGLYDVLDFDGVGAIIGTGDQFMTATDISAGTAISSTARNCMTNLSIANREKQLWDLVAETAAPGPISAPTLKRAAFDVCMTMTAMTTGATGNVSVRMDYLRAV